MPRNVGSLVRVKTLEWYKANRDTVGYIREGNTYFVYTMSVYCGRQAKVVSCSPSGEYRLWFLGEPSESKWSWYDFMLEDGI
jgi:hypothetical protein